MTGFQVYYQCLIIKQNSASFQIMVQVPQGETILVPAGVIHSNNYLQGGWNNIIAIEPDDEVSMVKKGKRFSFSFSNKCEPLLHTTEKQKERTDQIGVIPHDGPIHPTFASVAARLKTFEQWPPALKQKPTEMAEAGLIYLGLSDKVKCFYCDGGLKEWEEEDDPWVEHAGWYNKCDFLRLTKGDQFIEECRQFVNMTVVSFLLNIKTRVMTLFVTGKQKGCYKEQSRNAT